MEWWEVKTALGGGAGEAEEEAGKCKPNVGPGHSQEKQSRLIQKLHNVSKDSLGFFTSLHCPSSVNPCCPQAGSPRGAEGVAAISGITSRHNNVQSEKGNLERRLRALSLESNSFGS